MGNYALSMAKVANGEQFRGRIFLVIGKLHVWQGERDKKKAQPVLRSDFCLNGWTIS